ncbi:MAG TPA: hypothetical protein ENK28_10875, partial [Aliiroseovarius sp.]|nr:hypothetical protein [Aliiroseovarius sp.]
MVMKFGLGAAGGSGLSVAAGAVGAVALVAGGYMVFQAVKGPAEAPVAQPPVAQPIAQPVAQVPEAAEAPEVAAPQGDAPDNGSTDADVAQAAAPQFDLVRVEADGATIIAGLADPGADVHIELDGRDVAVVQADASGNFVALLDVTLMDRPQVVTLSSIAAGGDRLTSATSAIIDAVAPPLAEPESQQVAEASAQDAPRPDPVAKVEDSAAPVTEPEVTEPEVAGETTADAIAAVPEPVPVAEPAVTEPEPVALAEAAALEQPAPATPVSEPTDGASEGAQSDVADAVDPAPVAPEGQSPSEAPAEVAVDVAVAQAVPEAPAPDVLADLGNAAIEGPVTDGDAPPALAVTDAGQPPVAPAPPRILLASPEGITIVQPGGRGPTVLDQVTLDTISYDAGGEVELSGRGTGAANVQVYL